MADPITLEFIGEQLERVLAEQAAMRPFLEGIPVLGKSIEVLQRDVRTLRDDLHVTSAMAMRVDTTLSSLVAEFGAIHRWMSGINLRVRELEGKP
jgi:hypothetical protein